MRAVRAIAVVAGLLSAGGAQAQVATLCVNCEDNISAHMRWGQQLMDNASRIQNGIQQVQRLQATYQAITQVTDFGTAVSALGMVGIRNPLPIDPWAAQSLLSGRGSASGMLGNLSSLYTGTARQNRIYRPSNDTWVGQEMNERGDGLAGAQAMSLQLYQSAAERVPLLGQLQARLNTAVTPSEREALQARLTAENAYIQNQGVQAQALGNFAASERDMREQRREERLRMSIDEVLTEARGRGYVR